jgi:hypothetical protein
MARVLSEQGRDGVEAHAAVDGLGGQGVPELVGGDGADPGGVGQMPQGFGYAVGTDGPVVFDQDAIRA